MLQSVQCHLILVMQNRIHFRNPGFAVTQVLNKWFWSDIHPTLSTYSEKSLCQVIRVK